MIELTLKLTGIKNFDIGTVEDCYDNRLWVSMIKDQFDFDLVYTNNPWTKLCFKSAGFNVKEHKIHEDVSGRLIRRCMRGLWKDLVPNEVASYIIENKLDVAEW